MRAAAWRTACVLSFALGACGGRSERPAPFSSGAAGAASASVPEPVPLSHLCDRYRDARCQQLVACGVLGFRDVTTCARVLDCAGAAEVMEAISLGTLAYDPAAAGACLESFARSACSEVSVTPLDGYRVLASCPGAVTGLSGSGQACTGNAECAPGLFCKKGDDPSCVGTCGPSAVLGENCRFVPCADNLACDFSATCVPAQHAGDACDFTCNYVPGGGTWSLTCPSGQICSEDIWCDASRGQCAPGRLVGEPCGELTSDAGPSQAACAVNLWCSRALGARVGVCQPPGDEGMPCDDTPLACKPGLHCAGYPSIGPDARLGSCAELSGEGSSCNEDEDCVNGLVCLKGWCSSRSVNGGYCFADTDCAAALVCTARQCAPPLLPGDTCTLDTPCLFSHCVSGVCQAYAKYGERCTTAGDCTGQCAQGSCLDPSVCSEP